MSEDGEIDLSHLSRILAATPREYRGSMLLPIERELVEERSVRSRKRKETDMSHFLRTDVGRVAAVLRGPSTLDRSLHEKMSDVIDFINTTTIGGSKIGGYWYDNTDSTISLKDVTVFWETFAREKDLVVVKVERSESDLYHEAVVGMYGLNRVREYVPNFCYTYSIASCTPPISERGKTVSWCSSSGNTPYLFLENVSSSVTLSEALGGMDLLTFHQILFQIVNALNVAHKTVGFTHYDLHTSNVLVRTFPSLVMVPYYGTSLDREPSYISTRKVPYIIDFGMSRVEVGGVPLGNYSYAPYQNDGETTYPFHDLYKLICFIGRESWVHKNPVVFEEANRIFSFFSDKDFKNVILERNGKTYYTLPKTHTLPSKKKAGDLTHDDFLRWLESTVDLRERTVSSSPPPMDSGRSAGEIFPTSPDKKMDEVTYCLFPQLDPKGRYDPVREFRSFSREISKKTLSKREKSSAIVRLLAFRCSLEEKGVSEYEDDITSLISSLRSSGSSRSGSSRSGSSRSQR